MDVINTSGRRKTSVARIYMKPGKGEVTVNKRPVAEYFTTGTLQYKINQPFRDHRDRRPVRRQRQRVWRRHHRSG